MKLISFLAGLDQTNAQHGTTNDALLDAPKSRLSQILEALQHEDGYTMSEADQLYMTGWQHALMAIQGKIKFLYHIQSPKRYQICISGGFKNLDLNGIPEVDLRKQPSRAGNRFLE